MAENTENAEPSSSSYESLSHEERRNIIVAQLLARFEGNENEQAFPVNPTLTDSEESESEDGNEDRLGNTVWCSCDCCIPMASQIESVCCREITAIEASIPEGSSCITSADIFQSQIATEAHVRLTCMTMHLDDQPIVDADNNRRLRKTAYRSFIAWIYGYLGKGNRRVIPSCAVKTIREVFPDPNATYVGFQYAQDYDAYEMAFH
ncbi:P2X purinoceptor 7-like [Rana temporaria]|uniref:P2X purinoceptor 7-like n=1 Tax=Rana temporaria TaxID=8407 RepID=UPI001AAD5760|nr:P2X purinoceptor 7-like [Rana temporaria]XP_040197458.1 P2X purinoceptor 7-like [Rana temporaria]